MPLRNLFWKIPSGKSKRLNQGKLMELRLNNSHSSVAKGIRRTTVGKFIRGEPKIKEVSPLRSSNLKQQGCPSLGFGCFGISRTSSVSLTTASYFSRRCYFVRQLPVLQRLHIGETLIEDLTPLAGVNLTRLVFSPSNKAGHELFAVSTAYGKLELF